jgi:hypothetical protein
VLVMEREALPVRKLSAVLTAGFDGDAEEHEGVMEALALHQG